MEPKCVCQTHARQIVTFSWILLLQEGERRRRRKERRPFFTDQGTPFQYFKLTRGPSSSPRLAVYSLSTDFTTTFSSPLSFFLSQSLEHHSRTINNAKRLSLPP